MLLKFAGGRLQPLHSAWPQISGAGQAGTHHHSDQTQVTRGSEIPILTALASSEWKPVRMQSGTYPSLSCPGQDGLGAQAPPRIRGIGHLDPAGTQEPSCIWEGAGLCGQDRRGLLGGPRVPAGRGLIAQPSGSAPGP